MAITWDAQADAKVCLDLSIRAGPTNPLALSSKTMFFPRTECKEILTVSASCRLGGDQQRDYQLPRGRGLHGRGYVSYFELQVTLDCTSLQGICN